jgi:predicted glycosyltransferase
MKVVVDITHPAGVNFFKNAIRRLQKEENIDVSLIVQPRGKLVPILEKECPGMHFVALGKHRRTLAGKGVALLIRCCELLFYLRKRDFDVLANFDDLGLSYVSRLLRKPLVTFEDDIENLFGFRRYRHFPTRIVLPDHLPVKGKNIYKYCGFKELAYLHPNYFKPQKESLKRYGLENCNFIFIREVSSGSADYRHLVMGQLSKICSYLKALGFKIVLSLEEKSLRQQFEEECIILEEPVEDIFSLLHFATLTISSGDTMARESCLLGTPAIYTGGREMAINKELERKGCFFKVEGDSQILETIRKIIENDIKRQTTEAITYAIQYEWEDTTKVIVDNLLEVADKASQEADI